MRYLKTTCILYNKQNVDMGLPEEESEGRCTVDLQEVCFYRVPHDEDGNEKPQTVIILRSGECFWITIKYDDFQKLHDDYHENRYYRPKPTSNL